MPHNEVIDTGLEPDYSINWTELNLSALIPEAVQSVSDVLADTLEVLTTLLEIVKVVLDIVAAILLGISDLVALALEAAIFAIDAAIEFFIGTSISFCMHIPESFRSADNPDQFVDRISKAFNDKKDTQRPFGDSEGNFFMTWVAMAAVPDYTKILDIIEAIMELFGKPIKVNMSDHKGRSKFEDLLGDPPQYPPTLIPGGGTSPDWTTVRLADWGPFKEVVNTLLAVREMLEPNLDKIGYIKKLIEAIGKKIDKLIELSEKLVETVITIIDLLVSLTGLHVLEVTGTGSTRSISGAIKEGKNSEKYPFEGVGDMMVAGGVALHMQAAAGDAIEVFKALIGFAQDPGSVTKVAEDVMIASIEKETGVKVAEGASIGDAIGQSGDEGITTAKKAGKSKKDAYKEKFGRGD